MKHRMFGLLAAGSLLSISPAQGGNPKPVIEKATSNGGNTGEQSKAHDSARVVNSYAKRSAGSINVRIQHPEHWKYGVYYRHNRKYYGWHRDDEGTGPTDESDARSGDAPQAAPRVPAVPKFTNGQVFSSLELGLAQQGYYHGAIDGKWGSSLRAAIASYQAAHRLPQTGMPDGPIISAFVLKRAK